MMIANKIAEHPNDPALCIKSILKSFHYGFENIIPRRAKFVQKKCKFPIDG